MFSHHREIYQLNKILFNKTIPYSLIVLIALFSMNVWGDIKTKQEIGREAKSKAPHISSQQLSDYLSGDESYMLLDVRTEAEYLAGHIRGAVSDLRRRVRVGITGADVTEGDPGRSARGAKAHQYLIEENVGTGVQAEVLTDQHLAKGSVNSGVELTDIDGSVGRRLQAIVDR